MEPPASTSDAKRCPDCNALVSPDADWCGQCFRSLKEAPQEPEPVAVAMPSMTDPLPAVPPMPAVAIDGVSTAPGGQEHPSIPEAPGKAPTWPCPACGNANAIELDTCSLCGTSFAALMRQDEAPPHVEPKDALGWSLIYPGLGHRKLGRGLDGLARGVLFTMLAAMVLIIVVSGVTTAGLLGVLALYLLMALIVYLGSAYEAYRIAEGGQPLVTARALLWATVGIIMLSVVLLALTVASVATR
jgi:hypothetical protein